MNNLKKAKIEELNNLAVDNIETLLDILNIDYSVSSKGFQGSCPVHGGDNPTGWYLYTFPKPKWVCFTHGCHKDKFRRSDLVGLIAATKNISYNNAIKFLEGFVEKKLDDIEIDNAELEKRQFINEYKTTEIKQITKNITRQHVRSRLTIPAKYYLERGYSEQILDKFDVGISKKVTNRVVVPQYSDNGFFVGYTARTIFNKCKTCRFYHSSNQPCPQTDYQKFIGHKWIHNKGFSTGNWLYNYWNSKDHIKEKKTVVIVEGPGDVWRLEEAGIYNSVAIFGTCIKPAQKFILDASGAMSLIVLTDSDEAGKIASERIREEFSRSYRLYFPKLDAKDVGELSKDKITKDILPYINKIKELYQI